jgi:hypothetical protein
MNRIESKPARPPESYVVRIYRRSANHPGRIAGTVEVVASGSECSFASARELQRILGAPIRPAPRANAPKGVSR